MEITSINQLVQYFQLNFPEYVKEMRECSHHYDEQNLNPYHLEGDVWTHTMMVLMKVRDMGLPEEKFKISSIAALLHDIGKPASVELKQEKRRKGFSGHEGLSTFMAIEVLELMVNDGIITPSEAVEILKVINLHSELFSTIKEGSDSSKLIDKFKYQKELFEYVMIQSEADSFGRYYNEEIVNTPGRHKETPKELFKDVLSSIFEKSSISIYKESKSTPFCLLLVGTPLSGKSTFIEEFIQQNDVVVISRDDSLVEYGINKNLGSTYSEIWKALTEDDQGEIDNIIQTKFNNAVKGKRNIVIDMTNTSIKSRRRWLSNLPKDYIKKAQVFFTSFKEMSSLNKERHIKSGKNIPEYILKNMSKSFSMPMYSEFDSIEYMFQRDLISI
jgi:predicted kinase